MPPSPSNAKPASPFRVALIKGRTAAWENRWPGLLLWLLGVVIVGGYYWVPAIRDVLDGLGELKTQTGWVFPLISTAIFGGALPILLPALLTPSAARQRMGQHTMLAMLISNCLFWAYKGFEIDLLYQFQAWAFGNDQNVSTVVTKVVFDMGFYAPIFGLPNCVLFYIWRDNGYSWRRTKLALGENWYVRKILPPLISNFCVWFPAVIFIYNLPLPLQLPVQNLILCFWVLVLVFFTTADHEKKVA